MSNKDTLLEYFSHWKTPTKWSAVQESVEGYFHQDFVLQHPKGAMDRASWVSQIQNFADSGMSIEVVTAHERENGDVLYHNRLTMPDGKSMDGWGLAHFENGQCRTMTPQDEDEFQQLLDAYH